MNQAVVGHFLALNVFVTFEINHLNSFLFLVVDKLVFLQELHSLRVQRPCQIDDVQTAAERAVRDFIESSKGDS